MFTFIVCSLLVIVGVAFIFKARSLLFVDDVCPFDSDAHRLVSSPPQALPPAPPLLLLTGSFGCPPDELDLLDDELLVDKRVVVAVVVAVSN